MKIISSIDEIKVYVKDKKQKDYSVGFVPTMGYLHNGHLSLIKKSTEENDVTILSIFVNPIQFAANEDLSVYPRDFERDERLAAEGRVDVLFFPSAEELYPEGYQTYVTVENLSKHLCGKSRPAHFTGVTTVISKLFHIVSPDKAYFGQKDAQQFFVVDRMMRDLNFDTHVVMCPIIREKDGLAMSSRNVYLNGEERRQALCLNQSLQEAEKAVRNGERKAKAITGLIAGIIRENDLACIDYIEVVDTRTLNAVETIKGKILIALAVKFGNTRLIDNVILDLRY